MAKSNENEVFEGEILEALPNTMFRVEIEDGRKVLCTLKGRLRRGYFRIFPGDKVRVEMTPFDRERGRIIFKHRK